MSELYENNGLIFFYTEIVAETNQEPTKDGVKSVTEHCVNENMNLC